MRKRKKGRQVLIRILRSNTKRKRRKSRRKIIRGRGVFSNGFSFLGDLGKQVYHAIGGRWEEKETTIWKNLQLQKEWHYLMVELFSDM